VKLKRPRKLRLTYWWRRPQTYTIMKVSELPRKWLLTKGAMPVSIAAPAGRWGGGVWG
jgi:hypothetical protein